MNGARSQIEARASASTDRDANNTWCCRQHEAMQRRRLLDTIEIDECYAKICNNSQNLVPKK